ncbi:MAG: alpha/beta hydrolase [Pseudomonadota bacterium]
MKWALAFLVLAGGLAWVLGPREPVDRTAEFDPAALSDDLDAWLAQREAEVPDLRAGAEKRIVWAGTPGERTALSLVYVHGFSAAAEEIRPVPDLVAAALGANLHYTRLTGHGRDGSAMAEATAGDWVRDLAEAVEIGRRIGERVVLIGTSTGGTLIALAAHEAALGRDVAGLVFVSPNFRVSAAGSGLLTAPWARSWVPLLIGAERAFVPHNPRQAAHWTTRYPTEAVIPMAALVAHVRDLDHDAVSLPALFLYSEHDTVVSPGETGRVAWAWGGAAHVETLVMGPEDDPDSHVIAGDIMSPGQSAGVAALIAGWAGAL